jgi:hypothetical protein
VRWNLDRDTLVAFLNEAIMAIPSLVIAVRKKCVLRQLYLKTRIILPAKATLAFPAGTIASRHRIVWQWLRRLTNRPSAERTTEREHSQVARLEKSMVHELFPVWLKLPSPS